MSYNVWIALNSISENDVTAWEQIHKLADAEGPVPPVFQELITRLTAKFPCIMDLSDDEVDDGVWSDGPLRNNVRPKVTVLGMVYSRVDEVLPFLIKTSHDLGLVVLDSATGIIHRLD